jgi:hypothetical protein
MAANKITDADKAHGLFDIQELKQKLKTPDSIFQGVAAAEKWRPGKMVTEDEYKKVLDNFLKSPIKGKEVK